MERIAREYQTKEEISKEFEQVQDQVMSEMDRRIKQYIAEQAEDLRQMMPKQGSQGLDSSQYKKALELMLDLEKKTDQRLDDMAMETRKEMDRLADDKQLRADVQNMVDEKIENIEFNINNKVVSRLELLEKSYDSQAQNTMAIENKQEHENQKAVRVEETLKDQIELIQALNQKIAL